MSWIYNKDLFNTFLNDLGFYENPNGKTITQSFLADSYSILSEPTKFRNGKIIEFRFIYEFGFQIVDGANNSSKDEMFTRWETLINKISNLDSVNPLYGRFNRFDGTTTLISIDNDNKKWIGKFNILVNDSDCN